MRSQRNSHHSADNKPSEHHKCVVNDRTAKKVEQLWQDAFPTALLLPVIGFPSNSGGVATLTHTADEHLMTINGLPSKSPLANNALYSFECSKGKYINLYEIMLPDIPGEHGEDSTVEYYVKLLNKYKLSVAGVHFHWWGSNMVPGNTLVAAIHHQTTSDITPEEFSERTIRAIQKTQVLIAERVSHEEDH